MSRTHPDSVPWHGEKDFLGVAGTTQDQTGETAKLEAFLPSALTTSDFFMRH
jgi:hypothetical protein